jgi:hypothetical protein
MINTFHGECIQLCCQDQLISTKSCPTTKENIEQLYTREKTSTKRLYIKENTKFHTSEKEKKNTIKK